MHTRHSSRKHWLPIPNDNENEKVFGGDNLIFVWFESDKIVSLRTSTRKVRSHHQSTYPALTISPQVRHKKKHVQRETERERRRDGGFQKQWTKCKNSTKTMVSLVAYVFAGLNQTIKNYKKTITKYKKATHKLQTTIQNLKNHKKHIYIYIYIYIYVTTENYKNY